ncbi:DUF2059 domain-containing protein [Hyphomicrobium sp. 99]|uniref:DUF2059 domain-containing protein n=1 Tax=Hyphomicrobium sp. 99 TaxID=1163419 RepID=UPI0005F84B84|nr:DUF2059 domain-containing protein [Hyphomicrobium sp. 99]
MGYALRIIALSLICFSGAALAEDTPPSQPDPARVAAARDLLEVTGVTKQMDGMVQAMTRGFAKGANATSSEAGKKLSEQFDQSMKKLLEYQDQMISDFANLYAETFTAEEMKAVADFYRSGPGAKFISKTPELMKKGAEIGMKYSTKIADEMRAGETQPPEQK